MKKLLALCLMLSTLSLFARDIKPADLEAFSAHFKSMLSEASQSGFFCYVSENDRRIIACDDPEKRVNLGSASNVITNYLAHKLEKQGKFNRTENIQNYAKIFKYKAKKISFSDLISSTASIPSNLDKLYPNDSQEYEYFDFLWQMTPTLFPNCEYDYSKLSNLGAIYALSYSQSKQENSLLKTFESLVQNELNPEFPSIKLEQSPNNPLDLSYSLNLIDLCEYLAKEARNFSAIDSTETPKAKSRYGWLFTELDMRKFAIIGEQGDNSFLIANFYEQNIAIAIFIENRHNSRSFLKSVLQEFVRVF